MTALRDLTRAAEAMGVELPTSHAAKLLDFEALLLEHAIPLGLVASSDAPRIRERHILDCLRVLEVLTPADVVALDVGSGAGFPGVPVAISRPDLSVHLVEPRRTRIAFLELAVLSLGLSNAKIDPRRAEELEPEIADVAFARALAPPRTAWRLVCNALRPGGRLVCFAGRSSSARLPVASELLPAASSIELLQGPVLESAGPLIIMTR